MSTMHSGPNSAAGKIIAAWAANGWKYVGYVGGLPGGRNIRDYIEAKGFDRDQEGVTWDYTRGAHRMRGTEGWWWLFFTK